MDRESLYNGWARNKTFVYVTQTLTDEYCTVEAEYCGKIYKNTAHKKDMFGYANMRNIAFSGLQMELLSINKNIELRIKE